MPTYEYKCPKGHDFELFQKMSDEPVARCPECGAPAERLISGGAGFLFKGEGFYITDYRSKDYHERSKAETSPKDPSESTKEGAKSAEPKPASDTKAAPSSTGSGDSSS